MRALTVCNHRLAREEQLTLLVDDAGLAGRHWRLAADIISPLGRTLACANRRSRCWT